MLKGRHWGLLLLAILQMACGPQACKTGRPGYPGENIDLLSNPRIPSFTYKDAQGKAVTAITPVRADFAAQLKTPNGYRRVQLFPLQAGILFKSYQTPDYNAHLAVRTLMISPSALNKLQVYFSDYLDHPLSLNTLAGQSQNLAIMNWVFFGRIPGGDIIGLRCQGYGRYCQPGSYTNSEQRTRVNTHHRHSIGITHQNQIKLFRGGFDSRSAKWFRLGMGGGVLLFDKEKSPALYQSVGKKSYLNFYLNPKYNEKRILKKGQAGFPHRKAPRSGMGVMPDGSLVYVNVGEGKYRFKGGVTPQKLAEIMKQLGCVKALMFDGGGAPVMRIKDSQGNLIVRTWPEHTQTSNYHFNYAFLGVIR